MNARNVTERNNKVHRINLINKDKVLSQMDFDKHLVDNFCYGCDCSIIKKHELFCLKSWEWCIDLIPSVECKEIG